MAWALLAVPCLTAALTLGIARRGSLAAFVAVLGGTATLVLSVVALAGAPAGARGAPFAEGLGTGPGATLGGIDLPLTLALSTTSAFLALVVVLVTVLVQTYSAWYLADDDRRGVFHATIALFAAAMLLVVLSTDLILTVVGWEVMGWCSYLLIGHWSRREAPRRAGHAAFIVTRIADIGLLLGVAVLIAGAGTTGRAEVIAHWTSAVAEPATRSTALVLIVIGVLGKSAQLPFHHWLLEAMEGPTPASALIHAATMVAAGTVVLTQLLPLLLRADPARALLGLSVAATMVLAALCALVEPDLKRLLAWSTISQIGVMLAPLAAAGAGPTAGAALGHLYGHAIFKALLFLTVGWLAVTRGSTAASALVGSGRSHPVALVAWGAGLVSLAGLPLVLGGLTKEHVIAAVGDDIGARGPVAHLVLGSLLVTAVLTAAYATRALLVVVLGGDHRVRSRAVMPVAVSGILVVLAVASIIGGLALGGRLPDAGHVPLGLFALVLALVLVGVAIGYALHHTRIQGRLVEGRVGRAVGAGLGIGAVQQAVVVRPFIALARLVAFLDREVVDTYVRAAAWGVLGIGDAGTVAHRRSRPASGLALLGGGLLAVGLVTAVVLLGAT
ncbi:NADH-quinone oxidoreductase subunit 5 family protein [Janibacter limosus]|uniref:NADH-quinone oxidoreductase subunit 5 family protein n=1 Tax=Janibacter limosus TaxID=53458 RepID=UPI00082BDC49|nr:proton-conducting transporter membrane subunit [Janibacter limosus]